MSEEQYKKIIGLIVRNRRDKLKLTQEKLSERIGLDQSNLSNIENGKNFPSFISFCALIEALNIEPNKFLKFLKYDDNSAEGIDIEILEQLNKCPADIKVHFLELLKAYNN